MAQFKPTVITERGLALMAKIASGSAKMSFTKVNVSSKDYSNDDLSVLTYLSNVEQTASISNVSIINGKAVMVEAAVSNESRNAGYYVRTVGLYARDPQLGEILYSVTVATTPDWMPPYNGLSVSSILLKLVTTTSNAENVTLEVNPAVYATVADLERVDIDLSDIKGYIGYTDNDIVGVEVDLDNCTTARLNAAVGLEGGADFDKFNMFGGRRRCTVSDTGRVVAYYGDNDYRTDGSFGHVMVQQPKFWYKLVPLKLIKVGNREGFACTKFRLYLSDTPKAGFKIHPCFIRDGYVKDFVYLAAYEGSIYDTSANALLISDEQVADFTPTSGDKLTSISGAKPATGSTQQLTRANARILAHNSGSQFKLSDVLSISLTQMLFMVEYACADCQSVIGLGVADGNVVATGQTNSLGNASGVAEGIDGSVSVSYRGEENLWGNIPFFVDGINITREEDRPYITTGAKSGYQCDKFDGDYQYAGFQLSAEYGAFTNGIGWSEHCDFTFFPVRATGQSNAPLYDSFYPADSGQYSALGCVFGGRYVGGNQRDYVGLFVYDFAGVGPEFTHSHKGARLLCIPDGGIAVID